MDNYPEPLAGLVREHRLIEAAVAGTRERLDAALVAPEDASQVSRAVEELWLLLALLERELTLHIEKEEQVLFPTLRREIERLSSFVDDMISEHDEIKAKRALLSETLAALDDDHTEVQSGAAALRAGLDALSSESAVSGLPEIAGIVEALDWVFQGHFTGEEDGLFLPAEDFLSAATLAEMVDRMAEMESRAAT
jgi:hypothetical protein